MADEKTIKPKIEKLKKILDNYDFFNEKFEMERSYTNFLKPNRLAPDPFFIVLRRFNSYTPALPLFLRKKLPPKMKSHWTKTVSKGGGYFLWWKEKGIAIDPGFNFIENMYTRDIYIGNIDAIVLTHGHNDHYAELDTILTLLYQYNDKNKNNAQSYAQITPSKNPGYPNLHEALKSFSKNIEAYPYNPFAYVGKLYTLLKLKKEEEYPETFEAFFKTSTLRDATQYIFFAFKNIGDYYDLGIEGLHSFVNDYLGALERYENIRKRLLTVENLLELNRALIKEYPERIDLIEKENSIFETMESELKTNLDQIIDKSIDLGRHILNLAIEISKKIKKDEYSGLVNKVSQKWKEKEKKDIIQNLPEYNTDIETLTKNTLRYSVIKNLEGKRPIEDGLKYALDYFLKEEKITETKKVDIILSRGALKTVEGLLPLHFNQINQVHILNLEQDQITGLKEEDIKDVELDEGVKEKYNTIIRTTWTRHKDLYTDKLCTGLKIIPLLRNDITGEKTPIKIENGQDFIIGITSDTGWFEARQDIYEDKTVKPPKDLNKFFQDCQILVAHIGSIKEGEFDWLQKKKKIEDCYYKNHLGALGLIKLCEEINEKHTKNAPPKLIVISEYGEELKHVRKDITDFLNRQYYDESNKCGLKFISGDIGLKICPKYNPLNNLVGLEIETLKGSADYKTIKEKLDTDTGEITYYSP